MGPSGTTTFDYDDNGNMTEMDPPGAGNWDYQYDYENRLIGVTDNSAYTGTYTYSGDGLRLRVQETNHTYTDRWIQYDGVRPVLEGTLSGDTYTTTAKYVWEGNSYYDPLLFALEGGAWKHPMSDGLGSTRQLLDNTTQNVTDEYVYEAFGNLMDSSGSTPNPYKYVGSLGYYGTGSSLLHLGARYYLPEIGRFGSRDQLAHGSHSYWYAESNPAMMVDPAGLQAEESNDCGAWFTETANRIVETEWICGGRCVTSAGDPGRWVRYRFVRRVSQRECRSCKDENDCPYKDCRPWRDKYFEKTSRRWCMSIEMLELLGICGYRRPAPRPPGRWPPEEPIPAGA